MGVGKAASVFVCLLVFSIRLFASDNSIDVKLVNDTIKQLAPGSNSNIVIMLMNNSESTKELQLKVTAPEAWSLLTDYSSLRIGKKSRRIKILSFYVQKMTRVGADSIRIEVLNKTDNESVKTIFAPVYIKPRYELEINSNNVPEYVFAGDSLKPDFLIRNLSNTSVSLNVTCLNKEKIIQEKYTIKEDATLKLSIPVLADKNILYYSRQSVSITAFIEEAPEVSVSESVAFDVIPTNKVRFDAHNRLPVRIRGMYITDSRMGEQRSAYMFNVSAKGVISQTKKRSVEFRLRGPGEGGNPVFGLNDEYYLRYDSPKLSVVLGDNNYRLSDLTELSRYGRGAGLAYKLKKLEVGGYYNIPLYYPDVTNIYAAYARYNLSKKFGLEAGYLNKSFTADSVATLMTVSSSMRLFNDWIRMNVEYATGAADGQSSMAYKVNLKVSDTLYAAYLNYTFADANFPGYFSDSRYFSAGLSTGFVKNINFRVSYEFNHSNVALDTLYSNSPFTSTLSFSGSVRLKKTNLLGFAYFMRKREDRLENQMFNYEERTMRFTLQSRFRKIDINLYGEVGNINNLLDKSEGELTNVMKSYLSLAYKLKKNFYIDAFVNYQKGKYYLSDGFMVFYYGVSVNSIIKKKLDLMLEYQSNYAREEYYKDRSLLASRIKYTLNDRHELGVNANYNLAKNTLDQKEMSVVVNYSYLLNVPISKKKDIGSIKGKLINKGIETVEGIALTIAGNTVVTDKDGCFEFPVLKTGKYYLMLDDSHTGLNTIAEKAGPYVVEVLPGQATNFELGLTKSARIEGQIVIREDENVNDKSYVPVKEKLGNLIIEISKNGEVYRVYTDKNGSFSFMDLRTGVWKLKIYDQNIPSGYVLEKKDFEFNLGSGQTKHLNLEIRKKSRKIRFQKGFSNTH